MTNRKSDDRDEVADHSVFTWSTALCRYAIKLCRCVKYVCMRATFCVEEDMWFNVTDTTSLIITGTSLVVRVFDVQVALSF